MNSGTDIQVLGGRGTDCNEKEASMFRNLRTSPLGISALTQSELIELTLSNGFKGTDLDLVDFERQVANKGLAHARRFFDSARLMLGSFELPVDVDAEDDLFQQQLAQLTESSKLAAEVGCTRCRTIVPPAGDIRPYNESFEHYRRRYSEVADVLAASNIRLGLGVQAHAAARQDSIFQFVYRFDALLMLVKTIGHGHIGLTLDLWQWHVGGGNLDELRALTYTDLVLLDIADASTEAGDDTVSDETCLLPGVNGTIDAAAAMILAAEIGYDGPVTPVCHRVSLDGQSRDKKVQSAAAALDAAWTAAGLSNHGTLSAVAGS